MIFSEAVSLKKGKESFGVIHNPLFGVCCMFLHCEGGYGSYKVIIKMTPLIQSHVFDLKGSRSFQSNKMYQRLLQHRVGGLRHKPVPFTCSVLLQGLAVPEVTPAAQGPYWFKEKASPVQLLI